MSNPRLDPFADQVAIARQQSDLSALEPLENELIGAVFEFAPDLERATVGAALLIAGQLMSGYASQQPPQNAANTLAALLDVMKLAGQRLYAGINLPVTERCPVVYDSGARCKHEATAPRRELLEAQFAGHYATYHPGQTWRPAHLRALVDEHGKASSPDRCLDCKVELLPFVRLADGGFYCAPCALKCGLVSINDVRKAAGFPPFDEPEFDLRMVHTSLSDYGDVFDAIAAQQTRAKSGDAQP